jgi:CspA family cold shock protein
MSNTNVNMTNSLLMGCVKWFNVKDGYGFITVIEGQYLGTDIFVHQSCLNVEKEQYKYLVQGEYVEFILMNTTSGKYEFQAGNVRGIKNGKLMCETRNEVKLNSKNTHKIEDHYGEVSVRASSQNTLSKTKKNEGTILKKTKK